ncbi:MAG: glycoside hydrolase TIM-barrel-like domain-containing protein, partial [Henriciella sp.]|nr:glycoside hydrolase TIM-barrel-like domain-containing protein [Henriciella sp.]
MAEIVLSQVGAAVGAAALPSGLTVFGQTIAGAALGRAVGSLAGRVIDASMAPVSEGSRIKTLSVMESREGAGLPTVYGRMRVGGQVVWASRFREKRQERSAGKGGPKYSEYTYSVSFAVALCQGPITRVDRIWANGELVALADVNWRLYQGTDDQEPDPLIEAIEGSAPAYRGTAYIVFEDLPLDAFGNRLPQLSFEVVRAGDVRSQSLRELVRGVNIIPASGEFVYGTEIVRERRFPGIERALNMNNGEGRADFSLSVDQLRADLPEARSAALTVAWFGDSVAAATCKIRPGVETRERETVPYGWTVDGTGRGSAYLISATGSSANYGGTPADRCVLEGIAALKAAGVAVTLSPFLLMDSAGFPWRGRIGVSADKTASARTEIDAFVGADGGFGFRHFILHHARLVVEAGGVDAILIGSEMVGLTRIRDDTGAFPFVEALISIASEVRAIVGPGVKISYAADWTEYGAYVPGDGSDDVLFPLDGLWASVDVDFVGVDWYPPIGDWRDGDAHLDVLAGFQAADDATYLAANMAGGEAYDWYYADQTARDGQVRTPIVDTAHGEDWIFRAKDLAGWWAASHHARPGGVRDAAATAWTPGLKPVRLNEIGFPAIDRGGNAPNLFFDPKSDESALPPYSSGARDDLYQRRALSAALTFWQG